MTFVDTALRYPETVRQQPRVNSIAKYKAELYPCKIVARLESAGPQLFSPTGDELIIALCPGFHRITVH